MADYDAIHFDRSSSAPSLFHGELGSVRPLGYLCFYSISQRFTSRNILNNPLRSIHWSQGFVHPGSPPEEKTCSRHWYVLGSAVLDCFANKMKTKTLISMVGMGGEATEAGIMRLLRSIAAGQTRGHEVAISGSVVWYRHFISCLFRSICRPTLCCVYDSVTERSLFVCIGRHNSWPCSLMVSAFWTPCNVAYFTTDMWRMSKLPSYVTMSIRREAETIRRCCAIPRV